MKFIYLIRETNNPFKQPKLGPSRKVFHLEAISRDERLDIVEDLIMGESLITIRQHLRTAPFVC